METTPAPLALFADKQLRDLPDSAILTRCIEINTGLLYHQAISASAGNSTVQHACALGQLFSEMFRRHDGEFADWLQSLGEDSEGRPRICEQTALRYRTLWAKRDQLFPPDGSPPTCKSLTEAYIKVGLIPAPKPTEKGTISGSPFRISFSPPKTPPEEWAPADRQAFLKATEQIMLIRQKVIALAA